MTTGLDVQQIGLQVVRPVLDFLGMGGPVAEALILGTAAQESGFRSLHQVGGPALGLWQMEPLTHDDIQRNYLGWRPELLAKVERLHARWPFFPVEQLPGNHYYACAMARLLYWRSPATLPATVDLPELGRIYKAVYNTPGGAATAEEFVDNYRRLVAPFWGTNMSGSRA